MKTIRILLPNMVTNGDSNSMENVHISVNNQLCAIKDSAINRLSQLGSGENQQDLPIMPESLSADDLGTWIELNCTSDDVVGNQITIEHIGDTKKPIEFCGLELIGV